MVLFVYLPERGIRKFEESELGQRIDMNQVALSSSLSLATFTLYVMIKPTFRATKKLIQTLMRFSKDVNILKKDGKKISVCSKEQQRQSFSKFLETLVPNMFTNPLA